MLQRYKIKTPLELSSYLCRELGTTGGSGQGMPSVEHGGQDAVSEISFFSHSFSVAMFASYLEMTGLNVTTLCAIHVYMWLQHICKFGENAINISSSVNYCSKFPLNSLYKHTVQKPPFTIGPRRYIGKYKNK